MNRPNHAQKWLTEINAKIRQMSWETPQEISDTFHRMLEMFLPLKRYDFSLESVLSADRYGVLHLYLSRQFTCKMSAYLDVDRFGEIVAVHFDYGHSYAIDEEGGCVKPRECSCWVASRFISYYLAGVPPGDLVRQKLFLEQLVQKTMRRYPYIKERDPAFLIAVESISWEEAGRAWFEIFVNEKEWERLRRYIYEDFHRDEKARLDQLWRPFPWELC